MVIYTYYIIMIIFIILLFISMKNFGEKFILSEIFWIITPWSICLSLYYFGGITYQYKLGIKELLYILFFWFLFIFGTFIVKKFYIGQKSIIENSDKFETEKKIDMKPIFLISFISAIVYSIYIVRINSITFGVTRDINRNMFSTFLDFMAESSLIVWLYEFSYALLKNQKLPIYGYISPIVFAVPPLLISGRDGIMILLVSTFITFVYCGNYNKKFKDKVKKYFRKIRKILVLFLIVVLIYFMFLSGTRYGDDMIGLFEWSTKATISNEVLHIIKVLKNFGYFFLNIIYYYSSQFSKISFVIDKYDGPYLMGLFQLHILSRRLPESWGLNYINATNAANKLMKAAGYDGLIKIWGTVIQHYIFDFGRTGALVMAFLSGIFVGNIRKKFEKNKTFFSLISQILICTAMFITVQISPIFDGAWLYPFIWLIIIKNFYVKKGR